MPTSQEHRCQADHNREFLKSITDQYSDWYITVSFYLALQLLEACLALDGRDGKHFRQHVDRRRFLNELKRTRPGSEFTKRKIYHWYQEFYELSVMARYDCVPIRPQDKQDAQDALAQIERWASFKLGLASLSASVR